MFSMYIVKFDHWIKREYPKMLNGELKQQIKPIMRINGRDEQNNSCCLLIEDYYPYFYLLMPSESEHRCNKEFLNLLRNDLENEAMQRLKVGKYRCTNYIYSLSYINALNFYGYNDKTSIFIKVEVMHPNLIKQLADYAHHSQIMGIKMQPCESHIPYELKFLIDHNLRGMDWIRVKKLSQIQSQFPKHEKLLKKATQYGVIMTKNVFSASATDIILDTGKDFIDKLIDVELNRLNSLGVAIDNPESLTPTSQKPGTLDEPEYSIKNRKIFDEFIDLVDKKGYDSQEEIFDKTSKEEEDDDNQLLQELVEAMENDSF